MNSTFHRSYELSYFYDFRHWKKKKLAFFFHYLTFMILAG
jgi:hypothetical protein